jgi:hypothetical protein
MKRKIYFIPKFETFILKNGLKVFWHKRSDINTMGIKVFCRFGSNSELKEGLAHLIEHVIASYADEFIKSEGINANFSGSTNYSYTKYSTAIMSEDFENILDIIKKIIFDLKFGEEKVVIEKNKILPKKFKINPCLRLRKENFGGVVFLKIKFGCYLNKHGFKLVKLLKKDQVYTIKKIVNIFFNSNKNNAEIEKFMQYLFNREVIIPYKKQKGGVS